MIFAGWSLAARILAPLIVLAAIGAAVWSYGSSRYTAGREAERAEQRDAVDDANMRAAQAGHRYEEWKLRQSARVIVRIKEVDRALDAAPDWRDAAVPDSVRDAVETDPEPDPGGADSAVPAVRAPERANQWGAGAGLRIGDRVGLGLPAAASATE